MPAERYIFVIALIGLIVFAAGWWAAKWLWWFG